MAVICPAYRLAPEHPFPAGLTDAHAVMLDLQKSSRLPLFLSGDSAGGGLAASLGLLSVADAQSPAGVILLSPWLDLTVSDAAYDYNALTDPLFSRASAQEAAELYLQGQSACEPLVSPVLAPLAGFAPTFISVGEDEVLVQDAKRFNASLHAAGRVCELHVLAGMEHVAVVRGLHLTGGAETFSAISSFVERWLS